MGREVDEAGARGAPPDRRFVGRGTHQKLRRRRHHRGDGPCFDLRLAQGGERRRVAGPRPRIADHQRRRVRIEVSLRAAGPGEQRKGRGVGESVPFHQIAAVSTEQGGERKQKQSIVRHHHDGRLRIAWQPAGDRIDQQAMKLREGRCPLPLVARGACRPHPRFELARRERRGGGVQRPVRPDHPGEQSPVAGEVLDCRHTALPHLADEERRRRHARGARARRGAAHRALERRRDPRRLVRADAREQVEGSARPCPLGDLERLGGKIEIEEQPDRPAEYRLPLLRFGALRLVARHRLGAHRLDRGEGAAQVVERLARQLEGELYQSEIGEGAPDHLEIPGCLGGGDGAPAVEQRRGAFARSRLESSQAAERDAPVGQLDPLSELDRRAPEVPRPLVMAETLLDARRFDQVPGDGPPLLELAPQSECR